MTTSTNIAVVPAEARALLVRGMSEACKADGLRAKADKATAGASTLLTEAAIACGSGAAWKMLIDGYYAEVRANVGGAAKAIGATKGKNGEYLIPAVARTVVSELTKAFELGTSLFEPEVDEDGNETGEYTDKPRSFRKVRAANKATKDEAEAAAIEMGNPALAAFLKHTAALADAITAYKANAGYMLANAESEAVTTCHAVSLEFIAAVEAVAALRIAAEREAEAEAKAEAAEADKAGDIIADAEDAEAAPTPRKGRKAAAN